MGGQGRCEGSSEVFVKIQKRLGGVGSGMNGGRSGGGGGDIKFQNFQRAITQKNLNDDFFNFH